MITVLIPVGPNLSNRRWLDECIASVQAQTVSVNEILLVDDSGDPLRHLDREYTDYNINVWKSPWNLGVAHAFNCGVGVAKNKLVFMLGSDDTLEPSCVQECVEAHAHVQQDDLAYYYVGVRYMDNGEEQTLPCNAAMITKPLWRMLGGFPVASASGAPDAALVSIMLRHYPNAGRLRPVRDGKTLYNYRRHGESDTASKGPWQGVILQTRDLVTAQWVAQEPVPWL